MLCHRFDGGGESALMPRRFVLVDDIFVGDGIYRPRRALQDRRRGTLVAGFDCFPDILDGRAEFGAQARVVLTLLLALPRALSG